MAGIPVLSTVIGTVSSSLAPEPRAIPTRSPRWAWLALLGAIAGCSEAAVTDAPAPPSLPVDSVVHVIPIMTSARAINERGTILGDVAHASERGSGMWRSGAYMTLEGVHDVLYYNRAYAFAFALNDRDVAVGVAGVWGTYRWSNGTESEMMFGHAVMWRNAIPIDLGTLPGHNTSSAAQVNDAGDVVGHSGTMGYNSSGDEELIGPVTAVLWRSAGAPAALALLPSDESATVVDINNQGQAIGMGHPSGQIVLWRDGVPTPLRGGAMEGEGHRRAVAINDRGQVVGTACPLDSICRAFVWEGGQSRWLDPSAQCSLSFPSAIDGSGRVVGFGIGCFGLPKERALLWSADGRVMELPGLEGHSSVHAEGINRAGQIVGSADLNGTSKGRTAVTWNVPAGW